MPVIASNRIGLEKGASCELTFYGSSFITDHTGAKIVESDRSTRDIVAADLDLEAMRKARAAWGLFRDRRPELYGTIVTLDGTTGITQR
jgi:N-carbamoylputrescine amidase